MRAWLVRLIYIPLLVLGIHLYGHPERYERVWERFSRRHAHTISRLAGVVLILVSVLFALCANVFLH